MLVFCVENEAFLFDCCFDLLLKLDDALDEDDTATISLNDVSNFLNKYNFRIGFNV